MLTNLMMTISLLLANISYNFYMMKILLVTKVGQAHLVVTYHQRDKKLVMETLTLIIIKEWKLTLMTIGLA